MSTEPERFAEKGLPRSTGWPGPLVYVHQHVPTIYDEVRAERERAHAKHGDKSMESWDWQDYARLSILLEEVGEVAKEFNDAELRGSDLDPAALRAELIQVAAMATAWADRCPTSPGGQS